MKDVYRARDITEAHIVAGMLESRGIAANVSGFFLQGGVGELASQDFARVLVDEDDLAAARAVIEEYESAGRVDAPESTGAELRGSPALVIVLLFLGVFGVAYLLLA